jgi:hypothetical protein
MNAKPLLDQIHNPHDLRRLTDDALGRPMASRRPER